MTNEPKNLYPCPFCGSSPVTARTRIDAETAWWTVECHKCGCQMAPFSDKGDGIAAWNMRDITTLRDPSDDIVEAVARAIENVPIMDGTYSLAGDDAVNVIARAAIAAMTEAYVKEQS